MVEISHSIDSLTFRGDSIGRSLYSEIKSSAYRDIDLTKKDSVKMIESHMTIINADSLFSSYTLSERIKRWAMLPRELNLLLRNGT